MRKIVIFTMLLCFVLSFVPVAFADTDSAIQEPMEVKIVNDDPVLVDVNVTKNVMRASNSTGLKSVILDMIGDYETVVTDYTYNNGSYTSHSISIERDYAWIMSCTLLIVVMFCTFRIIGGIICK